MRPSYEFKSLPWIRINWWDITRMTAGMNIRWNKCLRLSAESLTTTAPNSASSQKLSMWHNPSSLLGRRSVHPASSEGWSGTSAPLCGGKEIHTSAKYIVRTMTDVRVETSWIIEQLLRHQLPRGKMEGWRNEGKQEEEVVEVEGTSYSECVYAN